MSTVSRWRGRGSMIGGAVTRPAIGTDSGSSAGGAMSERLAPPPSAWPSCLPSRLRICRRCHRLRMACSVRRGSRSAMRFQRWPYSRTEEDMMRSSSSLHDCLCSAPSRFTRGNDGCFVPQALCCMRAHRFRTASSDRPGSSAAIARHRNPSFCTPLRIAASSQDAHSLRLPSLRALVDADSASPVSRTVESFEMLPSASSLLPSILAPSVASRPSRVAKLCTRCTLEPLGDRYVVVTSSFSRPSRNSDS
mmetsp:Transcript_38831/g.77708  ORF Transcript_38831/g.77708 Transcript_38831/m.77708 type:complete len:250 (+) Transcript_38831:537-1286(+)